ncbi:hypothetical protein [Roseovarius salinarum]|uniref:hypothetical protein n=1 Tax=Roseovarius salinarum TaxID=1981892 RepID=UPI000C332000|nr:hypothetical protein [Roseovarius salinarum]
MRAILGIALLAGAALVGRPAAAQPAWQSYTNAVDGDRGAVTCPVNDAQTGHFYCLALDCAEGGEIGFKLMIAGGGALPEKTTARISVDGRVAGTLSLAQTAAVNHHEYSAPFDPAAHPSLVAAMKVGRRGAITLDPGGLAARQEFSLSGAAQAIDAAMRTCRMPQAAVPPDNPVARARAEVRGECGANTSFGAGFARRADLDGDGRRDILLDYGAVSCGAMASFYCGNGGCQRTIFRARADGGFDKVFDDVAYSITPERVLRMETHGSMCGRVGAEGCVLYYTWRNGRLERLDRQP